MTFPTLKSLIQISESVDSKKLMDSDAYKKLEQADAGFAKKLVVAWEGDARQASKASGKGESLVVKMMEPETVQRLSSMKTLTPDVKKACAMIANMAAKAFGASSGVENKDKSVWGHERWVKEGQDIYEALQAQVSEILSEAITSACKKKYK